MMRVSTMGRWIIVSFVVTAMLLFGAPSVANASFASGVNYPVGTAPYSIATGDLNGDAKPDVVAANGVSAGVSVLLGNGDGTFAAAVDYATDVGPKSVAIADLNRDTKPDLVVANSSSDNVSVLLGKGNGTFATARNYPVGRELPESVAIADLNGDAKPDLAVAVHNFGAGTATVLLGNGDGTFAAPVDYAVGFVPESVAIADLNRDAKPDLAVAVDHIGGASHASVLLGKGDGTFAAAVNYTVGEFPNSVAIGDLNGDARPDLAVSNTFSDSVSVLLGIGGGAFAPAVDVAVGERPSSVAIADHNRDAKSDLVVPSPGPKTVSVLLGNGDGTFAVPVNYAAPTPYWVAIADLNRDTKPDLASANSGSDSVSVLLGQTLPYISVAPTSGPKGTPVTVAGSDFMAGETVSVKYKTLLASPKSIFLCSATAAASSAFSCQGTVRSANQGGGPKGVHEIVAKGQTSGLKARTVFTKTPAG
jgi:hypothetical protein